MEDRTRWFLVTAVAPVSWGSTYVVTAHLLPAEIPLWGAVLRALPAGLLLLAVTRERPRGCWWWRVAVLGFLNVGFFFALVYLVAHLLPSGAAATLMATSPLVMMLLAWPLLKERPAARQLAAAAVGLVGVATMVLGDPLAVDPRGITASITAMLCSSLGYVLTRRWGEGVKVLTLTAWQLTAGAVLVMPAAFLLEGPLPALAATTVAAFGYVTLVATAFAFSAWFAGLRHLPAGTVGLIGLLNPVTGVALGAALSGEPFGLQQAAGLVLVMAGVLTGRRRASTPPEQPLHHGTMVTDGAAHVARPRRERVRQGQIR